MITTIYSPARAARKAAAKTLRTRVRRALAAAVVRYRNGADTTAALASGELVTVGAHMAALGADADDVRRYASHAGKKVRAAYTERTGDDPRRIWTLSRTGVPIQVYAYNADEAALSTGLAAYGRTAHLLTPAAA